MRWFLAVALLAACDRVFGLEAGGITPDGESPPADGATPDADGTSECDGTGYRQGNSAVVSGATAKHTVIGFSSQLCPHPLVIAVVSTRSADMPKVTDTELDTYAVAGGGASTTGGSTVWVFYGMLEGSPSSAFRMQIDTTDPPTGTNATTIAILEYRSSMSAPFDRAFTLAKVTGAEQCTPFSASPGELVVAAETYDASAQPAVGAPFTIRQAPESDDVAGATLAVADDASATGGDASATFTTSTVIPWACVIASFHP